MPFFVDVAAVRIQSWLSRTPNLRGRRGASALLSESTAAAAFALPEGCWINREAGDVDGVVSLAADSDEAAKSGSVIVAKQMRGAMPAIEVMVSRIVEGDDYVTVHPELHGTGGTVWQPAAPEVTIALPCAYCGHDPATRTQDLSPDRRGQPVCEDCDRRLARAGFSTSTGARLPRDQARVLDWLGETDLPGGFPSDFGSLCALDHHSTHVATIFCDGNRVGRLFEELASSSRVSKKDLASNIYRATTESLATAIRGITREGDSCLPISVHLVGGDDLLVSVPAQRGWVFTRNYLAEFGTVLARDFPGVQSAPTASAGVVFHHHTYPFSLVVNAAEHALKAAKAAFSGKEAAIAWADITADHTRVHGPRSVAWLDEHRDVLDELARTAPSQRVRLARLRPAEIPDQVRRLGLTAARTLFDADPSALDDGLSIVKWRHTGD